MSKCKECKTEMKALFSGEYCPNDCDRPEVLARRQFEEAAKKLASNKLTLTPPPSFTYWPINLPPQVFTFDIK